MDKKDMPKIFGKLLSEAYIKQSDILQTPDGFWLIYKSLSDILSEKGIFDFPDSDGKRLMSGKFYDDWFLYAVPNEENHTYSMLLYMILLLSIGVIGDAVSNAVQAFFALFT